MKDTLFNTASKKEMGAQVFEELLKHPGWDLFCKIIDANIELMNEQLTDPELTTTIEEVRRIQDKIEFYKEQKNTPQRMIDQLSQEEPISLDESELDPYDKQVEKLDTPE